MISNKKGLSVFEPGDRVWVMEIQLDHATTYRVQVVLTPSDQQYRWHCADRLRQARAVLLAYRNRWK